MTKHTNPVLEMLEGRRLLSAGQLDPTFGGDGIVVTELDINAVDYEQPVAVLPQANGKVIVVADAIAMPYTNEQPHRAVLVRYNAGGTLDPTFSGDGIAISAVPGWDSFWPTDAALLGNGSVLVRGKLHRRYDPNQPDRETDGTIIVHYSATGVSDLTSEPVAELGGDRAQLLMQGDGKVLIAGKDTNRTRYDFLDDVAFIDRINANNTPDASFGNNGRVILPPAFKDAISSVALRADGRIVIFGPAILQLNPDGSVDTSFGGGDGMITLPASQWTYAALAPAPDGGFYVTAWKIHNTLPGSIVKLKADGTVDPSFTNATAPGQITNSNLLVQPDGKILARVGEYIIRFNANGTRDLTFGYGDGYFNAAAYGAGDLADVNSSLSPTGIYAVGMVTNKLFTASLQNDPTAGGGSDADNVTIDLNERGLYIVGTAGADRIEVSTENNTTVVRANGRKKTFDQRSPGLVSIIGGNGNDYIDLRNFDAIGNADFDFPVSIEGGDGNDVLVGSKGRDRITGGNGEDRIHGWDGDDWISGNAQNDRIDGGAGNDLLYGNGGRDSVAGNVGDDTILGGDQVDVLAGNDGNDSLMGEGSHDRLDGGAGRDFLSGAGGDDLIRARDGEIDTIVGGLSGHDRADADDVDAVVGIEELL